jgi:hypothetical protein
MSTDALFGPDGTQAPEPLPVLPDPLVGMPSDFTGPTEPPPAASVAQAPDLTDLRKAVRSAAADDPPRRQRPRPQQPRPVRGPAPAAGAGQMSPSGFTQQVSYQPTHAPAPHATPTQPPSTPPAHALPRRAEPQPVAYATGERRGGWIGCIVALIFIVSMLFGIVDAIVDATGP